MRGSLSLPAILDVASHLLRRVLKVQAMTADLRTLPLIAERLRFVEAGGARPRGGRVRMAEFAWEAISNHNCALLAKR